MFLLFLCLGTGHVNAQVRIGGNAAPQGAAVLDLNADNTATPTGNKGALALPRVRLDSTTVHLNGVTPITGMLVWNTNTTMGVGIYFWSGSAWVRANLPATSPTDSGRVLISTGSSWALSWLSSSKLTADTLWLKHDTLTTTWHIVLDTIITIRQRMIMGDYTFYTCLGIREGDFCYDLGGNRVISFATNSRLYITTYFPRNSGDQVKVRCLRPSFSY